jgi:hypothetical protein
MRRIYCAGVRGFQPARRVELRRARGAVVGGKRRVYGCRVRSIALTSALAFLLAAAPPPPAPALETIPSLAASLADRLHGTTVKTPAGAEIAIVERDGPAVLSLPHLEAALKTVGDAQGWPSSWLVVQDQALDFDLVMHVRLSAAGGVEVPDVVFAASRREWDDAALEAAVREATGKKPPREKTQSLVVQSFSKKTETSYVYNVKKPAPGDKGLLPLLPEGSLIREATSVDLGDGQRHTLALVLVHPRFVPSSCTSCRDRLYGHADAGQVLLVLSGETKLQATLDLTETLKGKGKEALLPRYACTQEDEGDKPHENEIEKRFQGREPLHLLALEDYDGDGVARELALEGEFTDCQKHASVVAGIMKDGGLKLLVPR